MTSFTDIEIKQFPQIFDLFKNGGVVLYNRPELLIKMEEQLKNAGYLVHESNCEQKPQKESLLLEIVQSLPIPQFHPNVNLDGFNDYLRYLEFSKHKGIVIIIKNFHLFYKSDRKWAYAIADIFAQQHRSHLLMGNRLLTILQSDDPRLDQKIGSIGGYEPRWNTVEKSYENRGLS